MVKKLFKHACRPDPMASPAVTNPVLQLVGGALAQSVYDLRGSDPARALDALGFWLAEDGARTWLDALDIGHELDENRVFFLAVKGQRRGRRGYHNPAGSASKRA